MEVLRGSSAVAAAERLGGGAAAYWRRVLEQGAGSVAENLGGRSGVLWQGEVVIPFTALSPESDASFASSLRTQYLLYPQEELHFLATERERQVARIALQGPAGLGRSGGAVERLSAVHQPPPARSCRACEGRHSGVERGLS
jgi:hypothetical protein